MADIVRGRAPSQQNLPEYVSDFMLVHETGWDIDRVRTLSAKDRKAYNVMAQFSYMSKMQPKGF